mmetsp:Transcript_13333/g.38328  ORF Transcript_13333/g.38328 Transcript_13333/m.38328 type:complete len:570 (+) Transcript_13333:857-2566(+)
MELGLLHEHDPGAGLRLDSSRPRRQDEGAQAVHQSACRHLPELLLSVRGLDPCAQGVLAGWYQRPRPRAGEGPRKHEHHRRRRGGPIPRLQVTGHGGVGASAVVREGGLRHWQLAHLHGARLQVHGHDVPPWPLQGLRPVRRQDPWLVAARIGLRLGPGLRCAIPRRAPGHGHLAADVADVHEALRDGHHAQALTAHARRLRWPRARDDGHRGAALRECDHPAWAHIGPRRPWRRQRFEGVDGVPHPCHRPLRGQLQEEVPGEDPRQWAGLGDHSAGQLGHCRVPRPHLALQGGRHPTVRAHEHDPDEDPRRTVGGRRGRDSSNSGHRRGHLPVDRERRMPAIPGERRHRGQGWPNGCNRAVGDALAGGPGAMVLFEDSGLGLLVPAGDLARGHLDSSVSQQGPAEAGIPGEAHLDAFDPQRPDLHRRACGHHRRAAVCACGGHDDRVRARLHGHLEALPCGRQQLRVSQVGALCRQHEDRDRRDASDRLRFSDLDAGHFGRVYGQRHGRAEHPLHHRALRPGSLRRDHRARLYGGQGGDDFAVELVPLASGAHHGEARLGGDVELDDL